MEILITNVCERMQMSTDKPFRRLKTVLKLLCDTGLIEYESVGDNKIETTNMGIQKTTLEKNQDMEQLLPKKFWTACDSVRMQIKS